MSLESVFLDFGNTLVREVPSRFEIYAQAARERGIEITEDRMRELMFQAHSELDADGEPAVRYTDAWFRTYIERIFHGYLGLARDGLAEFQEMLFRRFSDARTFHLFPGAIELLTTLKERSLQTGIISNWSPRLPGLIERMNLAKWFDVVVCSAIERLEKPDPAIFELALDRVGVAAPSALHAGDHLDKDCLGARSVGMRAVLVDHSGNADPGTGTPRVRSLGELRELILAQLP